MQLQRIKFSGLVARLNHLELTNQPHPENVLNKVLFHG